MHQPAGTLKQGQGLRMMEGCHSKGQVWLTMVWLQSHASRALCQRPAGKMAVSAPGCRMISELSCIPYTASACKVK